MLDLTLALVMALVCILLHFEVLSLLSRIFLPAHGARASARSARIGLLATWTGLFGAHIVEIWLYALVYWACGHLGVGVISGVEGILDYGYYSAAVYTTLGFGDLLPGPGVRILTGSEALVGLCLIAWSASVTFGRVLSHTDRKVPPT